MKSLRIDRVELLRAIHEWCAGEFNPLIAFPGKGGFPNVIYLYDKQYKELRENASLIMECLQKALKTPIMVFTEGIERAPSMALTYKQWIDAGDTMKAIELTSNEPVYVLPVHDDDGNIIKYVSSERSYRTDELMVLKDAT